MSVSQVLEAPVAMKWPVPANYDEMFREYFPYMKRFVRKCGISPQASEDVAMAIFSKLIEKDMLANFDPNYSSVHKGAVRPAAFRTFLSGVVGLYVRHHRDRQQVHASREGLSVDIPMPSSLFDIDAPQTLYDLVAPIYEDTYEDLYETELVHSIRAHLLTVPRRNDQDLCDLPLLFEMVYLQSKEHEKVKIEELASLFDVSNTSVQKWMTRLRAEVAHVIAPKD